MTTIDLPKQTRAEAVSSLQLYFEKEMPEPLGDLRAGLLLNFILEEIGPLIYNRAVADAQARMTSRVADLSGELYADEFPFWSRAEAKRHGRR